MPNKSLFYFKSVELELLVFRGCEIFVIHLKLKLFGLFKCECITVVKIYL